MGPLILAVALALLAGSVLVGRSIMRRLKSLRADTQQHDAELREAVSKAQDAQRVLQTEVEYRRKVAANLRSTADFLEMAQAAGGFGIFDLDLMAGTIQGSAVFFELVGIRTEDRLMTREQWLCTIHPEDLESFVQKFTAAVEGSGQYETDYRSLWVDGTVRWLTGRGQVLRDQAGLATRVIGTITDITARRELEDQLRKTTESLNIAQASAGVATFDIDIPANTLLCSENYFELMRIPRNEKPMDRQSFLDRVHPQDLEKVRHPHYQSSAGTEFYQREYRITTEGDGFRWISEKANVTRSAQGKLKRITGAIMDVTDLKQAEAALKAAEKRLARAIRGTQDGLWELDIDSGEVWLAPRCEEMLGYAPGDMGHSIDAFLQFVHPQDVAGLSAHLKKHLEEGTPFDIEHRIRTKPGNWEWVRSRAKLDRDAESKGRGEGRSKGAKLAGSIQLVTDRHEAQQATLEAARVAEAASRAKSDFLANISHEIRTPMNGVIGVSQLLHETPLDKIQREYVDIIRGSAEVLLSLISDILDFSKIEAGRLELEHIAFDLRNPIYETSSALALQGGVKGIELVANVSRDVPMQVIGDPGRIRQIVMNLVGNALKFTHEGSVVVDVTLDAEHGSRSTVRMEVTDTGIGIDPARMERLFKPFSQVDSSTTRHYGGTGLGLSIVKRLVELMGGSVGVRSTPGKGSTFWITLELERAAEQPARAQVGDGRRVLVVDDLDASRLGLAEKLREFGFRPVPAASAEEALRLLAEQEFDVVIADELMPAHGGAWLLERIREQPRLAGIPFILMSMIGANLQDEDGAARPDLVMMKPVRGSTVAEGAASLLAGNTQRLPVLRIGAAEKVHLNGQRVMLVEDNAVNQRVAQRLLQKLGIEVVIANNGAEALERLREAPRVDAVLMDCQMPVMDGFTATELLRRQETEQNLPRLPVIALTANVSTEDRKRCISAGMDAHLGKPMQASQLRECLLRFLKRRAAPPVDMPALHEVTGGDAEFEHDLIETFIASGDAHLRDIVEALGQRDFDTIARRAHALKGSSANIRAERLSHAAAGLERAAQHRSESEVAELVSELDARYGEVTRLLRSAG